MECISEINPGRRGKEVRIRGRISNIRGKSTYVVFSVTESCEYSIQVVASVTHGTSLYLIDLINSTPPRSVVEVWGKVFQSPCPVLGCSVREAEIKMKYFSVVSHCYEPRGPVYDLSRVVPQATLRLTHETISLLRDFLISNTYLETSRPHENSSWFLHLAAASDTPRVFEVSQGKINLVIHYEYSYQEVMDVIDAAVRYVLEGLGIRCEDLVKRLGWTGRLPGFPCPPTRLDSRDWRNSSSWKPNEIFTIQDIQEHKFFWVLRGVVFASGHDVGSSSEFWKEGCNPQASCSISIDGLVQSFFSLDPN